MDFFAKSKILSVQKTFLDSRFKHNDQSFVVIYEAPYASFNHCDDDTADHYDDDDDDEDDNDDIGEMHLITNKQVIILLFLNTKAST